jgi:hypothetical protein
MSNITNIFPIDFNSKSLKVRTFQKYINIRSDSPIAVISKKKLLQITKKDIKILFTHKRSNKYPLVYLISFIKDRFNKKEMTAFLKEYPELLEWFI